MYDNVPKEAAVADNLAKILAITLMSGGVFSLPIAIAVMKEKGILRRYKVTPLRPISIILGMIIRQIVFMLLVTATLFIIVFVLYNADIKGNIIEWLIITCVGVFVFSAMGFFIGGIVKTNQGASGVGNILFMPMLFLSGASIPIFLFPEWLVKVAKLLPATHLNLVFQSVMFEGNPLSQSYSSLLILIGFGIVFIILTVFTARFE